LMVKNAAEGNVVVKNRPVDLKVLPFAVVEAGGVDSIGDNEERTQAIIKSITEIDPQTLARYYRSWLPLFESAYQELGESGSFDSRFHQAMMHILETDPYAAENAKLVRPSVYYKYADDELENASEVEKLLWRLGPENAIALQKFVHELRLALRS
jgi:hypothetical protein